MKMKILALLLLFTVTTLARAQERDYQWTKVEIAELNSGIKVTGRMIPQDGALNIESSRVAGRVLSILHREGDKIWPGSPLFEVTSGECFSLLEEKKVAAKNNMKDLVEGVTKRESQLALSVDSKSCKIVSTHGGILTKRSVESGAAFNVGDALVTVLDTNRLTGEFDLPERDMSKAQIGQAVTFRLASDPLQSYSSKISNIVPTIDSASRTTKIRIHPVKIKSATTQDALIYGEINTGSKESILKVPSAALVFSHDRQYVIKGPEKSPIAVEVQVIGEADSFSSVRSVKLNQLTENDVVASRGGIYLLKQLNAGSKL